MNFVQNLILLLSFSFVGASASSIGSEFDSSLSCSKFHFEEKVLEKLVRLEHNMQILEGKMDAREISVTSKLEEMNNIKTQTETFVQSVQDAQIRDQTRFNKSYQEIVEHFKTQATNETDIFGDQMNALLESLSSKMEVITEAEKKRESVKELMQSTLDQEKKRFNSWYDQLFENFKMNSNKKIQELIVNLQKGYEEMVEKRVAFSAYRTSSQPLSSGAKVVFDQVWTNVGNGYEPSTGVFTAPYVGLYHLTAVVASENNKSLFLKLYHNGNTTPGSWLSGDGYKTGTFDVVLNLQKGDRVYIFVGSGSYTIYSNSFAYLTFSGHSIA